MDSLHSSCSNISCQIRAAGSKSYLFHLKQHIVSHLSPPSNDWRWRRLRSGFDRCTCPALDLIRKDVWELLTNRTEAVRRCFFAIYFCNSRKWCISDLLSSTVLVVSNFSCCNLKSKRKPKSQDAFYPSQMVHPVPPSIHCLHQLYPFYGVAGVFAGANPSCLRARAGYILDKSPAHHRALTDGRG